MIKVLCVPDSVSDNDIYGMIQELCGKRVMDVRHNIANLLLDSDSYTAEDITTIIDKLSNAREELRRANKDHDYATQMANRPECRLEEVEVGKV
jgi:hypothetical protein